MTASAQSSYLGYPIRVTDHGYEVSAGGTRVAFRSMHRLRSYVRALRRLDREGATA